MAKKSITKPRRASTVREPTSQPLDWLERIRDRKLPAKVALEYAHEMTVARELVGALGFTLSTKLTDPKERKAIYDRISKVTLKARACLWGDDALHGGAPRETDAESAERHWLHAERAAIALRSTETDYSNEPSEIGASMAESLLVAAAAAAHLAKQHAANGDLEDRDDRETAARLESALADAVRMLPVFWAECFNARADAMHQEGVL